MCYMTPHLGDHYYIIPNYYRNRNIIIEYDIDNSDKKIKLLDKRIEIYRVELDVEYNRSSGLYRAVKEVIDIAPPAPVSKSFIFVKENKDKNTFKIFSSASMYDVQKFYWNKFFEKFGNNDIFKPSELKHHTMSVLIEKQNLTPLQLGKMIVFINSPNNNSFIKKIAQRESNKYVKFNRPKTFVDALGGDWAKKEGNASAIDIFDNRVVTIRLFKSTMDKETFFKNLEFVKALIDYCNTGVCSMNDCYNYDGFCRFVEKYSRCYPYLYKYLVKTKYCKGKSNKILTTNPEDREFKYKKNITEDQVVLFETAFLRNFTPWFCSNRSRRQYWEDKRGSWQYAFSRLFFGKHVI